METAACRAMWNSFNRRAEEVECVRGEGGRGLSLALENRQAGRQAAGEDVGSRQKRQSS